VHLTDPKIVEKLRRSSLSPSNSTVFGKDCVTRWAVEKLVGEGEENPYAAAFFGTCVHAIGEAMMVAPPAERTCGFFDTLVIQASDVLFMCVPEATNAQLAA
jgi:hypothetical protein